MSIQQSCQKVIMNRYQILKNLLHLPLKFKAVQSIEVTPANKKEDISVNRIIHGNIPTDVFCELLCPMCEQCSLVFGERLVKKQACKKHCCI